MISLLVVNYRSAELAAEAVRSARAAVSEALQVVIVDNSCDRAEAERLRESADTLIAPERNLGYAAAINRGREHCRGDVMIVINPDVIFAASSIDELARTIRGGAAVAGPALSWDAEGRWLLPPSDLQTLDQKIDEVLASRIEVWRSWRDRRRIRHRLWFWSLAMPTPIRALSGAVMAIDATVLDDVGGFDERFLLYFEENDFLRRVALRGERIMYVPAARCRHIYNQSAGTDTTRTSLLYAESERQYLAKWNGPLAAKVVKDAEKPMPPAAAVRAAGPIRTQPGQLVEASPLASFGTAAGRFADASETDVPPEVWTAYRSDVLYLRVIDPANATVLATYARYRS